MFNFIKGFPLVGGFVGVIIYSIFATYINVVFYYIVYVFKFVYSLAYYIFSILGMSIFGKIALYVSLVGFPLFYFYKLIKKL